MKILAAIPVALIVVLVAGCGGTYVGSSNAGSSNDVKRANIAASLAGGTSPCTLDGGDYGGGARYTCGSVTCYLTPDQVSPDGNGSSDYYDCIWQEDQSSVTGAAQWTCVVDTAGLMAVKHSDQCVP